MIGIFDSGIGGLTVLRAIQKRLSQYHYVYLADANRAPYGDKSKNEIYEYTAQAVNFLFKKGCQLVIIACNTASAIALRKIQKEFLPANFSTRKVLGIVVPNIETVIDRRRKSLLSRRSIIGIIGTIATIRSKAYQKELNKLCERTQIFSKSCPLLVPIIERDEIKNNYTRKVLERYLHPLARRKVSAVILACTHYPLLKSEMKKILGPKIKIIDTSTSIAKKTANYLKRHKEIENKLKTGGKIEFLTTGSTRDFQAKAKKIFKKQFKVSRVVIS